MSHAPSLVEDFPEYKDAIHDLKVSNARFSILFKEYDAVTHQLHRIEQGLEAHSDTFVEDLKKQRLALKDELFGLFSRSRHA